MDKFREAENNPFDAPVPGQGLTDKVNAFGIMSKVLRVPLGIMVVI